MGYSALRVTAPGDWSCGLRVALIFPYGQAEHGTLLMMEHEMEDPGSRWRHTELPLPDIGLPHFGPIPATAPRLVNDFRILLA